MVIRTKARNVAALCALVALAACGVASDSSSIEASSSSGEKSDGVEADLAAIADFNRRYVQAINDGDIDTLAALTTDEHIIQMPNRPPLVGKAANIEAMARVFEQTEIDESWMPVETVVDGDLAYQRGTYTVAARPKGSDGPMRTTTGSFLRIYRRQPNGEWRMTRDTFNSYPVAEDRAAEDPVTEDRGAEDPAAETAEDAAPN